MQALDPNRLKLWRALSDLFLDTEIDETTYAYIARVVLETGYTVQEAQDILWGEVFPVLHLNLKSVAGEWAGWPDDWLLERLSVRKGPVKKPRGYIAKEIDRCWKQVANRLPAEFL
jgi:hypothetical protein